MNARATESNAYRFRMTQIYNLNTGYIESADQWTTLPEERLFKLRTSMFKDRKSYGCPVCKTPVLLMRSSNRNWFFRHLPRKPGVKCIIVDENMPSKQKQIQKYNYAKESPQHIEMKNFIGKFLNLNKNVIGKAEIEKIERGTVTPTKWKKPDVKCFYGKRKIVFEAQISNTWLSDIVERDEFYSKNKISIIWVFNSFDSCQPSQDTTKADIFYNNPEVNLFVLDKEAKERSRSMKELNFNCYYRIPTIDYQLESIVDKWQSDLVTLKDLKFDPQTYKPYFVSYSDKREQAIDELSTWYEEKLIKEQRKKERRLAFEKERSRQKAEEQQQLLFEEQQRLKEQGKELAAQIEKDRINAEIRAKELKKFRERVELEQKLEEQERLKQLQIELRKKQIAKEIENKRLKELEAKKIENRCPKNFHDMNKLDCLELIFKNKRGLNLNSIQARIEVLVDLNFQFPSNFLDILESKGWVKKMSINFSIPQYERR